MIVYATVTADTHAVRPGEALDRDALAGYLRAHLDPRGPVGGNVNDRADLSGAGADTIADLQVSQFPGGHSNLTYLVRFGSLEFVLRRPPLGPVAPKAHDMAREYRWLEAVHPAFPLAPKPYLLCEDPSILGATFYVMERRRGLVVRREEPEPLADKPAARRRASEAIVDALAALHAVDAVGGAIGALGKPAGFVDRQVRGWTERWERAKTEEVPELDELARWLASRRPPDPDRPAIVHGDYKLDNVMLDPLDVGRLVAVLDWEMCALGDPLVDLGIFLAYWAPEGPPSSAPDALTTVTDRPGWLPRDEILERYTLESGRDLSAIRFYEVFARFKIAVVIQQIYVRYVRRQTDDPRFADFGARVRHLARQAAEMAGR